MRKHTEGPWHVGGPQKCTVYNKFGQRVANTFEGVWVGHCSDDECRRNAVLAAAAPEMLVALEASLAAINAVCEEMTVGDRFTNAGQALIDALGTVRNAIAIATKEPTHEQ
jgi:hypothetical protein